MAVKDQRRGARWMPLFYTSYFGELIDIARSHGYALALHGSVARDMDLILVPWVENPDPAEDVLKDFQMTVGDGCEGVPYNSKAEKPHGQMAYTIPIGWGGYLDIRVMPVFRKSLE